MRLNYIFAALSVILKFVSPLILLPCLIAFLLEEYNALFPFIISSIICYLLSLLFKKNFIIPENFNDIKKTEALFIVVIAWCLFSFFAMIPYLFFKISPLNALFEAVSGITTTGATILTNFYIYPKTMFFWRSLTQWLGGMGIIVLFIAVLPQFAVAGRQMFFAEMTGPTEDKLTPRIRNTASTLWKIYLLWTIITFILLLCVDMNWFDAICNTLSTVACAGFSPNPISIEGYNSTPIMTIITFFMFIMASNFSLQYKAIIKKDLTIFFKDDEFKFYLLIIFLSVNFIAGILYLEHTYNIFTALRSAAFQVMSIFSSTGFSIVDYNTWDIKAKLVLLMLMIIGACAGSAAGGIKTVRILYLFKYLKTEAVKILHPNAVIPIKINKKNVPDEVGRQIIAFVIFYITILIVTAFIASVLEDNAIVGITGAITTLGNVGPGFGSIGPYGHFAELNDITKLLFIINMLIGRLELIPFLAMLHPDFWHFKAIEIKKEG